MKPHVGRHEDDIDSDVLEKKEILHREEKQTVDEDSLVYIGTTRGIYTKDGSPSKAEESQTANRKPCASLALQTIEVSEHFAQSD